ncbi:cadherin repeat domain-containing protein, partial [Gammaproteobacteria bacterium]|nr:cadherin repeat domain-containing protein [Gammaproteobacteria bacterium]
DPSLITNHAPILTGKTTLTLDEHQYSIATLTGTDLEGDTLTYSITGGADQSLFSINSSTGLLSFGTPADYENPTDNDVDNTYEVEIGLSDGTNSTSQAISIKITNITEESEGPEVVAFTFSPQSIDITNDSAVVTVTVELTDETGVNTNNLPIVYIQLPSSVTATQQTAWFSLASGTVKDGTYTAEVTIPAGLAPGEWAISTNGFFDTLGNTTGYLTGSDKITSTKKTLTVINSVPPDTEGPEVVAFTFSPQSIDITNDSAVVTVTVELTDETGVNTNNLPIVYIQLPSSVTATQQTAWFSLASGTVKDGTYTAEVTIPAGLAPGEWAISTNGFFDTLGNTTGYLTGSDKITSTKKTLTVINSGFSDT